MLDAARTLPLTTENLLPFQSKQLGKVIRLLQSHIELLSDDSGRIVYKSSGSISSSSIYHLLNFFVKDAKFPTPFGGGGSGEPISYPLDAKLFANILIQAKVPASYLKMHVTSK